MRAVFTVDIPSTGHGKFPENAEILDQLRTHGWEFVGTANMEDDKRILKYKDLANNLLEQMPEVRKTEEAEHVIYYGELQDDKAKFVITRVVQGQMTFRLLHPNLGKLERSSEKMIQKLLATTIGDGRFKISNSSVLLYERGFEDIIIKGEVITKPLSEAAKSNRRDVLLVIGSFLIMVPTLAGLFIFTSEEHRILGGTLERLSTALITTIIVSGLGFFQTYYEILRERPINWIPYSD